MKMRSTNSELTNFCIVVLMFLGGFNAYSQDFAIGTYNVNYGNRKIGIIYQAIENARIDVLATQETTPAVEKQLKQLLNARYRYSSFVGYKNNYPAERFGFILKHKSSKEKFIPPKHGLFGTYVAVFEIKGTKVQLVNVHLDPARFGMKQGLLESFDEILKTDQLHVKELKNIFANIDLKTPTIILGDFNSISLSATHKFMQQKGFTDCIEKLAKNPAKEFSWHWVHNGKQVNARIDYIFCDDNFEPKKFEIFKKTNSDHYLLKVGLEIKNERKAEK